MPVEHINGKMAPQWLKCSNQADSDTNGVRFYYGYRNDKKPDISRYGVRERCRNLSVKPYTSAEEEQKTAFSAAATMAAAFMHDTEKRAQIGREFRRTKHRYTRLYNYAIARILANGGVSPW